MPSLRMPPPVMPALLSRTTISVAVTLAPSATARPPAAFVDWSDGARSA